jgi:membrane fusion protein, macrolide-specific efflux system
VPVAALQWDAQEGTAKGKRRDHTGTPAEPEAIKDPAKTTDHSSATASETNNSLSSKTDASEPPNSEKRPQRATGEASTGKLPGRKAQARVLVDGEVELRPVRVGVSNRVHAEVLEGLVEGDQVVSGTKSSSAKAPSATPLGGMGGTGGMGGGRR